MLWVKCLQGGQPSRCASCNCIYIWTTFRYRYISTRL